MTPATIGGEVLKLIVNDDGGFRVTLEVHESSGPGAFHTYHVTTVVPTGKIKGALFQIESYWQSGPPAPPFGPPGNV